MSKKLNEEIERVIKMAQREALKEVFENYMERNRRITRLLESKEYETIANMAFGERFTRLQTAWFKAFKKSSTYLDVAIEISNVMKKYY